MSASAPAPAAPRWKRWLAGVLRVALGVVLGLAAAAVAVRGSGLAGPVRAGAWSTSTASGHVDADMYTRARVAVGGLLALSRSETMYYVARHDDSGAPLRAECRYRVEGVPPPARWWSITAYAGDFYLFPNPQGRYSLSGATARLDANGRFALVTGPAAPAPPPAAPAAGDQEYWLPTPGRGALLLTFRLYNPAPGLVAAPASLAAPSITRVGGCQ
ncbi:MAG: DUF1214 domain-containing protein [Deltaproteobacteria bacterium]|nr:DUF1214 domain-containing protein [Deltaproteobacteria bacterium]